MEYRSEVIPGIRKTDIAVIGIAGKFPGAANHEAFWKNLQESRSSVQEVPKNRWDWEAYWGDPQTEKNKSNSKWGGFLKGVDHFDPDFFGLSAKEVERMDPQQRIMLELTWSCIEDAAIRPSSLSGKKVGVFLGVFNFDYKELQERNQSLSIEAHHSTGTASAIIANRISYYFNFKGPSIPIDTACSSSLNALHSAVQSLWQGECTLALAGGINLLLTPTRHISFSKTGMLSPTGSCKTFDDSADGYVRGEGAGLVLLKPLPQALTDKDTIYGIIKGSAVNHGGKTYSLTYPNPDAQKEVIMEAQRVAGVTPESISYVEAHGTGTPKGDPIEFTGLTLAFQAGIVEENSPKREHYCGLGSVKTNFGHLEAAAGIAGVIKVLLSMKYKQLPGLQNFVKLNHRISLEGSPFYLVAALQEWQPLRDKDNKVLPRRAGVSSFGFGGTNAHVVLEEAPPIPTTAENVKNVPPYHLVCISAKTEESLRQKEKDLAAWLNNVPPAVPIADICRTLSAGREHFPKRTAIIAENTEQLRDKLDRLTQQAAVEGCFSSPLSEKRQETVSQLFVEVGNFAAETLHSNKGISKAEYYQKLTVLAELYGKGYDPDWERPWFGRGGNRISMPTYPFAKESYWIPEPDGITQAVLVSENNPSALHPLRGQNTSNFLGQRFSTTLTGQAFFIKDHVVKGKPVLPGVAYLEMVRAAVIESTRGLVADQEVLCLKNIVWAQPIRIGGDTMQVHTALSLEADDTIAFEVFSESPDEEGEPVVYSWGSARFERIAERPWLNTGDLAKEVSQKVWLKAQCYRMLKDMGFDYGPAHQGLAAVYPDDHQLLAKLALPAVVANTLSNISCIPAYWTQLCKRPC